MKKLCALLILPWLFGCNQVIEPENLTWQAIETETDVYRLTYPKFTGGPTAIVEYLNKDLPTGTESFVRQAEAQKEILAPWILAIEAVYQYNSPEFTSLQLNTYDYTGGAHGNAYYGVLNYDNIVETFITLPDLFTDDRYLEPLADFIDSEVTLLKSDRDPDYDRASDSMFDEGIRPVIENFRTFVFEDGPEGRGMKFLFAPYQLGAYVEGSFEILVPVGILAEFVKPEYQPWFAPEL